MKQLPRLVLALSLLTALPAFADSVKNYNNLSASWVILPNDGTGGNMGGSVYGSGVNMSFDGGTPFDWYNNFEGFAPGSVQGGETSIYLDYVTGTIGSHNYSNDDLGYGVLDFNAGLFTLPSNPTDGQTYTFTVPAGLGLIVLTNCTGNGCKTFNLYTAGGQLTLSYVYYAYSGLFFGTGGTFIATGSATIPEPATLGFVAFGIAAAAWRKRKLMPV